MCTSCTRFIINIYILTRVGYVVLEYSAGISQGIISLVIELSRVTGRQSINNTGLIKVTLCDRSERQ